MSTTDFSTPSFNPKLFNHELFNPMIQKFMVEKSRVEKFLFTSEMKSVGLPDLMLNRSQTFQNYTFVPPIYLIGEMCSV